MINGCGSTLFSIIARTNIYNKKSLDQFDPGFFIVKKNQLNKSFDTIFSMITRSLHILTMECNLLSTKAN